MPVLSLCFELFPFQRSASFPDVCSDIVLLVLDEMMYVVDFSRLFLSLCTILVCEFAAAKAMGQDLRVHFKVRGSHPPLH